MTPHPVAVGNCAEEIYFGLLKARRERKKLAILLPFELFRRGGPRTANGVVAAVGSEFRAVSPRSPAGLLGRAAITAYFGFFRVLGFLLRKLFRRELPAVYLHPALGTYTLWQPRDDMSFSWAVVDEYRWREQLATPLPVWLDDADGQVALGQLGALGLPGDAWWVCLHVREGGFWGDQCVERNADIANYIGAIEEITSRGGWVVRMGDSTMKRLPPMERVIDYPFTGAKSPLMDVFLISGCRMYIGMSSGIYEIAILFQRPIILTNMWSWIFPYPQKPGDLSLLKHVYSRSRGRFLSLSEWLAEPFDSHFFYTVGEDYEYHENDSDELRAVVREFFERPDNWQPTELQRAFSEGRLVHGRRLLGQAEPIIPNNDFADSHQRYRLASRLESSTGFLGSEFARRNWERDARNPS